MLVTVAIAALVGQQDWGLPVVVSLLVASLLLLLAAWAFNRNHVRSARERAAQILEMGRREAEVAAQEARSRAVLEVERMRAEQGRREAEGQGVMDLRERELARRAAELEGREGKAAAWEARLQREDEAVAAGRTALRALNRQVRQRMQEVARLSAEEIRERLVADMRAECEDDLRRARMEVYARSEQEVETEAQRKLVAVMQRLSARPNQDLTATLVSLPSEEMKGRIIGREGRNIKAFEAATGVTLLIDDSPQTVLVSSFDPVRREVARAALTSLIRDGRIHPATIEEAVARAQKEVDAGVLAAGGAAAEQLKVGGLSQEVLAHLGRLKFRFSFNQNVLDHSVEVAQACSLMASELGIDPQVAKRAGLLHDIGKGIPAEVEGSHARVGAEFMRRHGEAAAVVNAIAAHHEEVPAETLYAGLVILADRISAVRPGARAESMAAYVDRLERLERLATALPGVQAAYAVSAGREVRVLVTPEGVDDAAAAEMARTLRRKIEDTLQYPGTIRVTVIREQRFVETAR